MSIQTNVASESAKLSVNNTSSSALNDRIQNIYQTNQTVQTENYDVGENLSSFQNVESYTNIVAYLKQEMAETNQIIQQIGSKKIFDSNVSAVLRDNNVVSEAEDFSYMTRKVDTTKVYDIATDGSSYTDSNSYVNTKNGLTYKLYDQGVGEWAGYQYDDGRDMRYRGCMLTAASCVSSSVDSSITPGDFFNSHRHDFVEDSVPDQTGGKFQAMSLSIDDNLNSEIIQNLSVGNPVIIMVKGYNDGGSSPFTSGQHYMALLDISDDGSQIFVGNSHTSDGGDYSSNGWYPTSEVLTSIREATAFVPTALSQKVTV